MFKSSFKNIIKKVTITAAMATSVSFIVNAPTEISQSVQADTHTVQADGPWEVGHGSDGNNYDAQQAVHNGNEIYYSIAPNDKNTALFQQSAANWNALGVIKLVQVNWGDQRSEITMQSSNKIINDNNKDVNGKTNIGNGTVSGNKEILSGTNIELSTMLNRSQKYQQAVSDHELGHALGFAHDNRRLNNGKRYKKYTLTMNAYSSNKTYKLGGIEQRTLADHYGIQPSNGYLNTNC